MSLPSLTWKRLSKRLIVGIGLMVFMLVLASCQSEEPAETPTQEPAAVEAPAEEAEATEAPEEAEEPAATEEPAEEAEATAEPAEEATAEPAEEAEATAEPAEEAEATAEPAEEPEATAEPAEEEASADVMSDPIANGQYIANLTGGCGCHFNREVGGLAGGNTFQGPFGVVYARNITPDPETGIGEWSPEDIAAAIRLGTRPDGTQLHPVMPYRDFSLMSEQEALTVAAYLLSLEPVANEVPERELTSEPEPFTPAETSAEPATDPVARGEVLVTISRCGACHTPAGASDMYLAGGPIQNDEIAPNITPDEETGIGAWSAEEIAHLMQTGERPDGSMVEGSMAQQIERRFSQLTDEDALAIGEFLKSIPAVSNNPYE